MTVIPTPPTPVSAAEQRPWIFGVVLIVVGALLFVGQFVQDAGWLVLGGLALVFLAVYAWTRKPGWVIPGLILAGLAVGVAFESYGYDMNGSVVVLGLAAGFLGIAAFNYSSGTFRGTAGQWWPLIPGGILALVGISQAIGGSVAGDIVEQYWPLVLIAVGVLVLLGGRQQLGRPKT
jgi:hypothetical protein